METQGREVIQMAHLPVVLFEPYGAFHIKV